MCRAQRLRRHAAFRAPCGARFDEMSYFISFLPAFSFGQNEMNEADKRELPDYLLRLMKYKAEIDLQVKSPDNQSEE